MVGSQIVNLNVGGTRFSTSWQTLTWIPDSFFTALLSGRISSLKDESGAYFIDRDPVLFNVILNYLRSRDIDINGIELRSLRNEAEFYGITPLVKRIALCEDLDYSSCGSVLFYGYLPPAPIPIATDVLPRGAPNLSNVLNNSRVSSADCPATPSNNDKGATTSSAGKVTENQRLQSSAETGSLPALHKNNTPQTSHSKNSSTGNSSNASSSVNAIPGFSWNNGARNTGHTRSSSVDMRSVTHSRNPSFDSRHSRNSSADLNKYFKTELSILTQGSFEDPLRVRLVRAHQNWIAVAYAHFISCYRLKDSSGWQLVFTSPRVDDTIDRLAINAKLASGPNSSNNDSTAKMVAIAAGPQVHMWGISDEGIRNDIGRFSVPVPVEHLFYIGSQLVALSQSGKICVWHAMTQHVLVQDLVPIQSFDTAGSFLLLGCSNGAISYIDMQKFPLRMKDNDLLVTELYRDPSNEPITAISVYLTPKTSLCGNWIEIAYGTQSGLVRVIVQHPETVGHGPQLFQTFTVHRSPVTRIKLSEKYLVSVCNEYNHVRSYSVTRFRGMISTHPGSTPLSSFKIVSLEGLETTSSIVSAGNDCGPYGEQDDEQVFVQKVIPEIDEIFVRLASNGKRICTIKSVDGTNITSFCVHECEGSSRLGSRPRRFIFTGHASGAIQMWDLTTALEMSIKADLAKDLEPKVSKTVNNFTSSGFSPSNQTTGGPTPEELLRILDLCDLSSSQSHASTPCPSPCPTFNVSGQNKLKASNIAFLSQQLQLQKSGQGENSISTDISTKDSNSVDI